MFVLMFKETVGRLWLQSIKNLLYVKSYMCDGLYFSVQHGIQVKKKIGFRTEEELADAVNENVNDSDSDNR